jgi:putative transposase
MPILQRCYRFRMRPSREKGQALFRQAGARRFVWNWALARRKAYFAEHGQTIPAALLSKELTALKSRAETAWLQEADSQALQQTLRDLEVAFRVFFEKRARFPRFKSKKRDTPRFRIPQRVKIREGKVYVPKVGWVRLRQSQIIDGQTKSATFKRDACGHWYVTLVVAFTLPDVILPPPDPEQVIGIDAGLKDFAVFSTGERVPAPKFFRAGQRKLRRAQRVFGRRKAGSNRKARAKTRVARVHQKIANQRGDFLHKLSTRIIKRFAGACIEDLSLKGLVRTKLAKSFSDAALGEFFRQLRYKARWQGKHLIAIDRFFPSSKRCHACGAVNEALTLAERQWTCPACGAVLDRDHNASQNIRDEGLHLFAVGHTEKENARGVLVSPPPEAENVKPRIPRL